MGHYSYDISWATSVYERLCLLPVALSLYSVWLRDGRSGDRIPVGARFFAHVQTGPGAHPASCTMGTGSFPGVKRPGRDADHPPRSRAEVKKGWSYTSIHPLGQFRPVTGVLYLTFILVCWSCDCQHCKWQSWISSLHIHGRIRVKGKPQRRVWASNSSHGPVTTKLVTSSKWHNFCDI
jgi:hypothetical protein